MPLLEIRDLNLAMRTYEGESHVLRGVNLSVEKGEICGIVGETGSGKSLTGLTVSHLVPTPPGRYLGGEVLFEGVDVLKRSEKEMMALRGRRIGMIFQDPTTNLNPAFRIGEQLADVALSAARSDPGLLGIRADASRRVRNRAAWELGVAMLERVGIHDPASRARDYPNMFSGGMRQRVLIAMGLIGQPSLLIADEPTTALDVSVQAQILRILYDLVEERGLTLLFITHNLGVVAQICSRVAVMHAGRIVEQGPVHAVFKEPQEPYTRALLAAVPTRHTVRGMLGRSNTGGPAA